MSLLLPHKRQNNIFFPFSLPQVPKQTKTRVVHIHMMRHIKDTQDNFTSYLLRDLPTIVRNFDVEHQEFVVLLQVQTLVTI